MLTVLEVELVFLKHNALTTRLDEFDVSGEIKVKLKVSFNVGLKFV